MHGRSNTVVNSTSNDLEEKQLAEEIDLRKQQHESVSSHASINNQNRKGPGLSSFLDTSDKTVGTSNILRDKTHALQVFEASSTNEVELNVEKVNGSSVLGESNQGHPTSILDKLFGSALTLSVAGSSSVLEVVSVSN